MSIPKPEVNKTPMTLDQIVEKFGALLIRGLNLNDDKDKQILEDLKKLSYSDAKDLMKYIESYMDPIKRYELIQVLIKSNEAKDKSGEFQVATFIRGNSAGRGFFSAYQDVSQLDENITSFLQLDPKCVRGVFNKIPWVIYQHYRDFNIPEEAIADNFLFNFLTPLNLAYLQLKIDKRSDYSLAIYILKGGVPSDNPDSGYQRTINSLEAKIERDPEKLMELKKLYLRAKNKSLPLTAIAGSDIKLLEQLKQFEELDKKKDLAQKFYQEMQEEKKAIINRYKEFKAGQYKDVSPEKSTQEQPTPQNEQAERLKKFNEDLPKIKQVIIENSKAKDQKTPSQPKGHDFLNKKSSISDEVTSPVIPKSGVNVESEVTPIVGKKQSPWSRFVSGVQSAWKSVTDALTKPKSDVSETTPLTQVTSSGKNQTGEKKSRWNQFKDFVRATFASSKLSENAKTVESRTPENTGKVARGNQATSDIGKLEVTFAGMNSLNNPYENKSSFEMDLKNRINGTLRCINLVQLYFIDIDINTVPQSVRGVILNDEYGQIAENIMALEERKKAADERQLMLITLAENQILLHLDNSIKVQDSKISNTKNPKEIEQYTNARNALLYIRDKISYDLKIHLPEEVKYVSVDKPEQITKKFVGEKYRQMNTGNGSDNDIQKYLEKINNQLSEDMVNIKQMIEANSGKSSPEIRKALMELHVNLNAYKDQVNKSSLSDNVNNHTFNEIKDMHLQNIKSMEEQAREINTQMLNVEKKDKWQNIASTNLKNAGENLKRSVRDLSESLSKRIGNSPRKSENFSPIEGATANNPTFEQPSTPLPTPTTTPTTTPPPTPRGRSFGG